MGKQGEKRAIPVQSRLASSRLAICFLGVHMSPLAPGAGNVQRPQLFRRKPVANQRHAQNPNTTISPPENSAPVKGGRSDTPITP